VSKRRKCPWCGRIDPRLDHNYKCKKCGRIVLAHWSNVERRNEIERPLHSLCLCPKCAQKLGIVRAVKYGMSLVYEWIGERPKLDTDWGERY
jgi:hypothetical protein